MKQKLSILLVLSMLLTCITPTIANETQQTQEPIENTLQGSTLLTEPFDVTYEDEVNAGLYPYDEKTVLVKLAKKTADLKADEIAGLEYLFSANDSFWYTANLAEGTTPKQAIETLRDMKNVLLAEYNYLYEAEATTLCDGDGFHEDIHANPKHKDEWHLDSCGIQNSWRYIKDDCHKNPGGDSSIVVAIIDTGVDYDHEDLKNNMWTNTGEIPGDGIDNDGNGYIDDYYGVDIVARKGNGDDDHGHGTHVAGIIAAANNNIGVVGVAYNTKIMAIKAGQASGNFLQTDICKAINYARENGADVINMSFGGSASTIAVQDALETAYTHSVLVAAAGNDGFPNELRYSGDITVKPSYPAAYSFVLGVMSVDIFGIESSFTNYDIDSFNSIEYEVYAPGNAITSTIPNDKYATWNGTSMAAPIVSGMAAVLRSVYNDPDKYPTKFIYGQLTSTSDRRALCCNPKDHGIKHLSNIPQIVNLYAALTKMPKPEISVSDYTTFDSKSINNTNNGDGTIDSGETITLGFELRNRWGMSDDTIVTIDALSPTGISNPYVEFSSDGKSFSSSASINYGCVGTYSTQDCGKIIEDGLFSAWEKPFYVKIAKDAPNETILAINVNIESKNALDLNDKHIYSTNPVIIDLVVKNGVVLPQVIDEDITLTKDNYYIIQNSTVIEDSATVTVTEGANIQFWTNDSTDPYAANYIAGLVVKGKLNCIGTEYEHVKIFPSDLMANYQVEIYESGTGTINYKYTDITNLYTGEFGTGFTKAENCEFNSNFKSNLSYKSLEPDGNIILRYHSQLIRGDNAVNSAFYKIGSSSSSQASLHIDCDTCAFIDSNISFSESTYENCVFYGNNNYWDDLKIGGTSRIRPYYHYNKIKNTSKIIRNEATGKIYLQINGENRYGTTKMEVETMNRFAKYIGGELAQIETKEELDFLKAAGLYGALGAKLNKKGDFEWLNGEKIGDFITIGDLVSQAPTLWIQGQYIRKNSYYVSNDGPFTAYIIEVPGEIHIEEITFAKQSVSVDKSATYQILPQIYPSTASGNKVLYFSSNKAIANVDENGLVAPIGTGTAKIYAFSEDMQVCGSMEIVVKDEINVSEESNEYPNDGVQTHFHNFTTETVMPSYETDGKITNTCECSETNETILPKLTKRISYTAEDYTKLYNEFEKKGYNTNVWNCAILNRLNDTDITKWLRITSLEGDTKYSFGGNWWGTTNKELINHQIIDYNDYVTLGDINEGEFLTEAPENTFPFVTEAYILDESGEVQSVVSGGKVKFVVKFNRDMDTEYGLNVYFGSTYPYGDYEIDGSFTDARTWVGETTLKTVIENGYQFIKVANGRTAADENGAHLKFYNDWARFGFEIDTTSAMAMMMQGYADNGGIHLEWMQDDYDTLAGYNVYRATSEDGNYVKINSTIIPSDENTYYDTDVEPGKQYYYTFTVVLTDVASESKPAGKIAVTAKDTMAPNVYHSPVYTATTGNKIIISATVSDNIGVQSTKLYYRVKGTNEWKTAGMTSTNDKYTAAIPASTITLSGIEYYITAFDGANYTYAGGKTSVNPYEITIYAAVENNAKGDVDGDGNITILDALKLLRAIYDESLLTQEEFLRADINGNGTLEAVEALRILQYANKTISSVLW